MAKVSILLADELWINPPAEGATEAFLSRAWMTDDKGRGRPGAADPHPLMVLKPGTRLTIEVECRGCLALLTGNHGRSIEHTGHAPVSRAS